MAGEILAIDQGTTSTRAIVFDGDFRVAGLGQQEFPQHFPASGWVEHEPEDIWQSVLATARQAIEAARVAPRDIAAIGIANQRETTLIWDRATGRPIHRAIVWQDRRTSEICARLRADGMETMVNARTGLLIDPYFSASKIAWLLDHVPDARRQAEDGKLAFGTIDTFLLWRLTGGRVHATDATNASRTLLFNIGTQDWDDDLLRLFDVPRALLPAVRDSAADFGTTEASLFGASIAIRGVAGDQQAATVGQACFAPGMVKATYGTGCFAVLHTGAERVTSTNRLLSTVAYRLNGRTTYALEGAIFVAGAVVQWLRDGLGLIKQASEIDALAAAADPHHEITLVPAFTGLGAPWWDAEARGAMFGLTRSSGPREFARAALNSVCLQTVDLLDAMKRDWSAQDRHAGTDTVLRVDGGMVASGWTMQRLADLIDAPVDRPRVAETTALGAAWLAGMQAGVWPGQEEFAVRWQLDRRFTPAMPAAERTRHLTRWHDAVRRTLTTPSNDRG